MYAGCLEGTSFANFMPTNLKHRLQSTMLYHLGALIVKGGKVISTGHNHQRPHFDDSNISMKGPLSMHAEMHAIYNLSGGRVPPFKQQVQPGTTPEFTTSRRKKLRSASSLSSSHSGAGAAGAASRLLSAFAHDDIYC